MFRRSKLVRVAVLLWFCLAKAALAALAPAGPDNPGPPDTPRTGTVKPYPLWYKDTNGLTLGHCLDNQTIPGGLCIAFPPNPDAPQTFPGNFGEENFFWLADSNLSALATGGKVVYRAALESSFFNAPTVTDGEQTVFARIRIRIDVPVTGTYTVTHPFGVYVQNVTAVAAGFEINVTQDIGCLAGGMPPCDFTLAMADPPAPGGEVGPVTIGPFLTWETGPPVTDAAGNIYIGNPTVPHTVVGSPFATNFLRVEGPAGSGIGGPGVDFIQEDHFLVSGKLARGPLARDDSVTTDVNTPVMVAVLTNDAQPPPTAMIDPTTVMIVTAPGHGMATPHADGTVTYTPATDFRGPDSFKYTVADGGNPTAVAPDPGTPATSNIATVNVMIPTTTTTTTTLPCVTARCIIEKALTGPACQGTAPAGIANKFRTAETLIDQADTSSGKKAAKLRARAMRALKKAKAKARRAAKRVKISSICADDLRSAADSALARLEISRQIAD